MYVMWYTVYLCMSFGTLFIYVCPVVHCLSRYVLWYTVYRKLCYTGVFLCLLSDRVKWGWISCLGVTHAGIVGAFVGLCWSHVLIRPLDWCCTPLFYLLQISYAYARALRMGSIVFIFIHLFACAIWFTLRALVSVYYVTCLIACISEIIALIQPISLYNIDYSFTMKCRELPYTSLLPCVLPRYSNFIFHLLSFSPVLASIIVYANYGRTLLLPCP